MSYEIKNNRGFIKTIVVIIVAVIVLSYLGFDLKKILTSDIVQKNFSYLLDIVKNIWADYLARPVTFLWDEVLKPLTDIIWSALKSAISYLQSLKKNN